jgi:hypothetical protein
MQSEWCEYGKMGGEPGVGLHRHFFGFALFDILGTVLIGAVLAKLFHWSVGATVAALFLIGIFLHRLFCVRTTVDKLLFP